jgi:hypothetical protein
MTVQHEGKQMLHAMKTHEESERKLLEWLMLDEQE